MTTQPLGARSPLGAAAFKLNYPMSLGVYATYAEAQKAVDYPVSYTHLTPPTSDLV